MRKLLIIGIGPGDPEQITVQAINALNRADVFFIPDKGAEKAGLRQQRQDIIARYLKGAPRLVAFETPARAAAGDYLDNVAAWHAALADVYARLFADHLGPGECGAFLVWGDPALYDSTLRIVEAVRASGAVAFDYDIIPGVSSIQALAARHRIALNGIGEPVLITTGRRLAESLPATAGSVVVMLDGGEALSAIEPGELEIFWGANIGAAQEAFASGRLADVKDEIRAARERVKRDAGFVMDAYLLRRPRTD